MKVEGIREPRKHLWLARTKATLILEIDFMANYEQEKIIRAPNINSHLCRNFGARTLSVHN